MQLQRCEKNHFYDRSKFAECPYCAIGKIGLEEKTEKKAVYNDKTEKVRFEETDHERT